MVRNSAGLSSLREAIAMRIDKLPPRERQVLGLVVKGNSNKPIAKILDVGQRTVEPHRARVMKQLGARSIAQLIRLAIVGARGDNVRERVDGALCHGHAVARSAAHDVGQTALGRRALLGGCLASSSVIDLTMAAVGSSAGKSISRASSDSVTSVGVPKIVVVLRNDTVPRR